MIMIGQHKKTAAIRTPNTEKRERMHCLFADIYNNVLKHFLSLFYVLYNASVDFGTIVAF